MARCWTCGTHIENKEYPILRCAVCRKIKAFNKLRERAAADPDSLPEIQQRGFEKLSGEVLETGTIVEWGFEDFNWRMQQETGIPRGAGPKPKSSAEIPASRYREMAEESWLKGSLYDAERNFLRAFHLDPSDYGNHMGLAYTNLLADEFDEAKEYLEKSLPYAPDSDWKSYSYRLIGHIYACKEEYSDAVSALQTAVELSPTYYMGFYDLAQYAAQMQDEETCLTALKNAIMGDQFYFYLAQREKNFEPLLPEVIKLLEEILFDALDRAETGVFQTEEEIKAAEESIAVTWDVLRKCPTRQEVLNTSIVMSRDAKSKVDLAKNTMAKGDYKDLLNVMPINEEAHELADRAKDRADKSGERYENMRSERLRRALMTIPITIVYLMIFGLAGALCGYGIAAAIGAFSSAVSGGDIIGIVSGAVAGCVVAVILGIRMFLKEFYSYK